MHHVNAIPISLPTLVKPGAAFSRLSGAGVTVLAATLAGLIGWLDCVTGDFSMAVFYLIPVGIAAWSAGRASGLFVGLVSMLAWFIGNTASSHAAGHPIIHVWNAAVLALIYFIVAYLLSALHRVQRELEERVERRTISLAEVHHRVKNNLQIISSLLMLQAEELSNPEDKAVFAECRERIHSMARLHEQLYSKGNFDHFDFAAHLRDMVQMLVHSHSTQGCKLALEFRMDPVAVDLDTAVMLGLIANELLLNALKHGFRGRSAGRLTVELHAGEPNEMTVRDDGCGLPPGFDSNSNAGLGTELVIGMTRQIHGEAKIESAPGGGTCATISFPLLGKSPAAPKNPNRSQSK